MERGFIIVIIFQLIFLSIIMLYKYVSHKQEQKKVNKIINSFNIKRDTEEYNRLRECINIIEMNRKGSTSNG